MISSSKKLSPLLFGLMLCGLLPSHQASAINFNGWQKVLTAVVVLGSFNAINAYIALKQDEPKLEDNANLFKKAIYWYRVFCGQASKEKLIKHKDYIKNRTETKKVFEPKPTGVYGRLITFYDSNIKDAKVALGLGALSMMLATGSLEFKRFGELFSYAPYAEFFAKKVVQN